MIPMISIVVPVYNSELYIRTCIESIIQQTFREWELLLIDDGSDDDSLAICRRFEQSDSRIKVFHKENGGVGSARNMGIRLAKGSFLMFIDSDDFIKEDMLAVLFQALQSGKHDLVLCGYSEVLDETTSMASKAAEEGEYSFEEYITVLNQYKTDPLCGGPVAKLYKKDLLDSFHIEFLTNTSYAEDFCFNLEYLKYCHSIRSIQRALYCYRISTKNSLSKLNKDIPLTIIRNQEIFELYQAVFEAHGLQDKYRNTINEFYFYLNLMLYTQIIRNTDSKAITKKVSDIKLLTGQLQIERLIAVKQHSKNKKYKIMAEIILLGKRYQCYLLLTGIIFLYCKVRGL